MDFPPLVLRKGEERRIRAGHLWVFSNEVDTRATPLSGYAPGQAVEVQAAGGKPLGTGYVNPNALICARIVSRDPRHPFGPSLLVHRLKVALALRERLYSSPHYRLVHGESDGLPGLVVDRYGEVLAVQINTAGMEAVREPLLEALDKVLHPEAVLLRNDGAGRALEGLPSEVLGVRGAVPETVVVPEGECRFQVPLVSGQKTGWFYDQRCNRERMRRYVRGRRVLDLFSYLGAWGIQTARAGADSVLCVEASEAACAGIRANAEGNGVADRVEVRRGDAFEVLKALQESEDRFDAVILDPPAFMRRKKDIKPGLEAYRRLNQLAMRVLQARDGILISASCSSYLEEPAFLDLLRRSALHLDRRLQILERGHQGPDHPLHPAIPETAYLKALFCRLLLEH